MTVPLHEKTVILLVDAQPSFLDQMHGAREPVEARLERLLRFARMTAIPVIATFERPTQKKGLLPPPLEAALPPAAGRFEKSTFDAMGEESVRDALSARGREHVVVAGSETDVCVLLTVLGLLEAGYRVTVLTDCVFTSEPDPSAALERMRAAGAVPSTFKTFAYEITGTVDRGAWPQDWLDRLTWDPSLFPPPEDLPRLGPGP